MSSNCLYQKFANDAMEDVKLTEPEKKNRRASISQWLHRKEMAGFIDKASRVLFPGLFIAFNIVYWPVYMTL